MKMRFGDGVHHVAVSVAIGVDEDGFREVLGVCQGGKEDKESWLCFLRHLKERGLRGPELCISDACLGLREALGDVFPKAKWQRCIVLFYRNVSTQVHQGQGGDGGPDPVEWTLRECDPTKVVEVSLGC